MRSTHACLALLLAAALLGAPPILAQVPSAKPTPAQPDAAFEAQRVAFLVLPAATRVAAQDALVWLGLYNGTSDGDFGKRTRDAIVAFETGQQAPGDGVLSPAQLQALLAAGDKARAAVGFRTIADPKTGARIGAPLKLLSARSGVTLDFASDPGSDLAALYARLAAESPARKVAYKAIKAGAFFVVSGQDAGRTFYTRYELNPAATPPIRGFTFSYPVARGDLFRVALGVADAFVAFPPPGPATTSTANADAAQTPPAQPPEPKATALTVARDRALTALTPRTARTRASAASRPGSSGPTRRPDSRSSPATSARRRRRRWARSRPTSSCSAWTEGASRRSPRRFKPARSLQSSPRSAGARRAAPCSTGRAASRGWSRPSRRSRSASAASPSPVRTP